MGKLYKIVICGMKNVGKTTILEQVIYGNVDEKMKLYPTIEDIYLATVETDRGSKELFRIYDTCGIDPSLSPMSPTGDQSHMMKACSQLAKQYNGSTDGYILVYDVTRSDTFDCLVTMKKEIDKIREKKEGFYLVLGHDMQKTDEKSKLIVGRAITWATKERLRHFEVNACQKQTLYEPFVFLASKIAAAPSKGSFSQLSVVRKTIKNDP